MLHVWEEVGGMARFPAIEPHKPHSRCNLATKPAPIAYKILIINRITWRRKRDSNPRTSFPVNGFQDRRLKPLGHSSTSMLPDFYCLATLSLTSLRGLGAIVTVLAQPIALTACSFFVILFT